MNKIDYAKAILKRDSEEDDYVTDDICDLARALSELILKERDDNERLIEVECPRCNGKRKVTDDTGMVECSCGYIYEVEQDE